MRKKSVSFAANDEGGNGKAGGGGGTSFDLLGDNIGIVVDNEDDVDDGLGNES